METLALREKLHALIDKSSEEKLLEAYALFEEEYSDEFKAQLEEEYADYKSKGKVISKVHLDQAIEKLLYSKL